MTRLSERIRSLASSPTFAIQAKAKALEAAGRDILDLSAGEPDFLPPEGALEAARTAITSGANRYAPVAGVPALRQAVADLYNREHGLQITAGQVLVSHGGKQALSNLTQCLLGPGDEAIVLVPGWVSYAPQIQLAGATVVPVVTESDEGFQPDPDVIAAAITERTRLILLNSPNNPTGCVIDEARLRAIDEIAERAGVVVVSDELYRAITFGNAPAVCHGSLRDPTLSRTVIVDAISKTWAMTGWRVGFLLGPTDVIEACARLQGHTTSGVCRVNEAAALQAITGSQDFLAGVLLDLEARRDLMVQGLQRIDGVTLEVVPDGAFYVFPRVDALFGRRAPDGSVLHDAAGVAAALLDLTGVATVPGGAFGEPRCIRLSYATSTQTVIEAMARLAEAVARLR